MKLTQEQIKAYDEEGYILLPSLFSQQEAALMKSRLPALFQMNRDEVIKEKVAWYARCLPLIPSTMFSLAWLATRA